MPIYELINPSDPYTFEAPNIEVAGVVACGLSSAFGAKRVGDDVEESSPILYGWLEWEKANGIDVDWLDENRAAIADALDSFMIGSLESRRDVEVMLAEIPEDKRERIKLDRQHRHRTSLNQIGEYAYRLAKRLRAD